MEINILNKFEKEILPEYSNKVAINDGDRKITFKELADKARSLASEIVLNVYEVINKPILVYLNKGADNIIADLGIVYSGNAYSNLDIKNPDTRIKNIIININPVLIITTRDLRKSIYLMNSVRLSSCWLTKSSKIRLIIIPKFCMDYRTN